MSRYFKPNAHELFEKSLMGNKFVHPQDVEKVMPAVRYYIKEGAKENLAMISIFIMQKWENEVRRLPEAEQVAFKNSYEEIEKAVYKAMENASE